MSDLSEAEVIIVVTEGNVVRFNVFTYWRSSAFICG